jgi:DNA-binding beta-propeller fold protein YncE
MLAGRAPAGMAVTNSLPYLLVTNPETNSLTVLSFDNPGRKLVGVVQVGQSHGTYCSHPMSSTRSY